MGIINLTPDSFYEPSRYDLSILDSDADIVDIGAVSSRPGASEVPLEEEWRRLEPFLRALHTDKEISIDTTRSEIVRRAYGIVGPFIVNDISSGEDDPRMLETVASLGLGYVAMCRNSDPFSYFGQHRFDDLDWILDPGFGFNKDSEQNVAILSRLEELKAYGRPLLVGVADKRFTRAYPGGTEAVHLEALRKGADILRVHDVKKARQTVRLFEESFAEKTGD